MYLVGDVTPQTALHWQNEGGVPRTQRAHPAPKQPRELSSLCRSLTAGIGMILLLSLQLPLSSLFHVNFG